MLGAMPEAAAYTAGARPISPPSKVTNEFRDIFCALNGATLSPCCLKIRHSAVTRTLFPTEDPVP